MTRIEREFSYLHSDLGIVWSRQADEPIAPHILGARIAITGWLVIVYVITLPVVVADWLRGVE